VLRERVSQMERDLQRLRQEMEEVLEREQQARRRRQPRRRYGGVSRRSSGAMSATYDWSPHGGATARPAFPKSPRH
jgi:phage shock protein A